MVFGLWSLVPPRFFPIRNPQSEIRNPSRQGFTLVELLVAAGITALIAGFIAVILRNVSGNWTRASGRLGADAQARIVLDQLQLDLQGAFFRDDGNVWLAADILDRTSNSGLWDNTNANVARLKPSGGLSLQLTQANIEAARFGQAGVWLRFFTTSRGANTSITTISAPIAVGYQIIRRPTATNTANANVDRAYLLHRAEVRAAATTGGPVRPGVLETGYTITAGAYSNVSTATNSGAVTGDPRSVLAPGSNTSSPRNLDSVLADNVIDFGVRCYVRDTAVPGGLRLIFPVNAGGVLSNSPQALRSRLPSTMPTTAPDYETRFLFPDVIDVMLRVLTDEGAALIGNLERNQTPVLPVPVKYTTAPQWWWGVAQENSRVYTRRIVLNAKSH